MNPCPKRRSWTDIQCKIWPFVYSHLCWCSWAIFLYYLTHYLVPNQGSCNYPCVPSIFHFSHPCPLPATVPFLFESIVFVYCLEYLSSHCPLPSLQAGFIFLYPPKITPVKSAQDLHISNPVMSPQFLTSSSCRQEWIQLFLPSSLKMFSSLSFLDAILGALPTREVVFANLLWASPQPVHIQVPWSSYHFSICPPSQSKINLLALNIT